MLPMIELSLVSVTLTPLFFRLIIACETSLFIFLLYFAYSLSRNNYNKGDGEFFLFRDFLFFQREESEKYIHVTYQCLLLKEQHKKVKKQKVFGFF